MIFFMGWNFSTKYLRLDYEIVSLWLLLGLWLWLVTVEFAHQNWGENAVKMMWAFVKPLLGDARFFTLVHRTGQIVCRPHLVGGNWLPFLYFPRNIGFRLSSQLPNSNLFQWGGYPQPPTSHCPHWKIWPFQVEESSPTGVGICPDPWVFVKT